MEQFIDHISAQTETIKNTLKNDDNKEAFENILDEVISTFNPVLEVLNLHVDQTNPTTSPIRVLKLSERIASIIMQHLPVGNVVQVAKGSLQKKKPEIYWSFTNKGGGVPPDQYISGFFLKKNL